MNSGKCSFFLWNKTKNSLKIHHWFTAARSTCHAQRAKQKNTLKKRVGFLEWNYKCVSAANSGKLIHLATMKLVSSLTEPIPPCLEGTRHTAPFCRCQIILMNNCITVMVFMSNKAHTEMPEYQEKQKNTVNAGIVPAEC